MTSRAPNKPSEAPRSGWLSLVRWLSVVALGLSAYLLYGSLTGERLPGCGLDSGCGTVLNSRWAYLFGLPVSLFALLAYLTVLGASVALRQAATPSGRQRAWGVLIAAAIAILGAAFWFVCLQLIVVRAVCPFCMAAHAAGFWVAILILANTPGSKAAAQPSQSANATNAVPPFVAAKFALAGIAAVGILVLGQVVHQPQTYAVRSVPPASLTTAPVPSIGPGTAQVQALVRPTQAVSTAQAPKPKPRRLLKLHGDAFALDLAETPLLGSPEAPSVIVDLFDYSCSHCRQVHPILVEAYQRLSNQLAIVCLPVPLATNCNRVLKAPIPAHVNACAYAKTGLAVWRANPKKLAEFDDWVFMPPRPPSPEEVEYHAMRLVGTNEFRHARSDPWVEQQLELDVRLYESNLVHYGRSVLPELLIGPKMISGVIPNLKTFYQLLTNQFDLRLPADAAQVPGSPPTVPVAAGPP